MNSPWLNIGTVPPPDERAVLVGSIDEDGKHLALAEWDGSRDWHTRDPNTGELANILRWKPTHWRP